MHKVILDTNIFLIGLLPKHKYGWVIEALKKKSYNLYLSNEIIFEYQEKLQLKYGVAFAEMLLDNLKDFENVHFINPYFNWQLIEADPDDNKFVDCAIAGNVDFIVSNDRHFRILEQIEFPKLKVLQIEEFGKLLGYL